MQFLKNNMDKLLGVFAILIIGLTVLRMAVSFTIEPGEEAEGAAAILQIESAPESFRKALPPKQIPWSFEGITGTFDKASVRRGLQVYREVCSACHGLKYIAFRNLTEIGYSEDAAKEIAESYSFPMIDEFGDEVERPGTLTDYFPEPFPNENAAKAANGGKVPPDLSLMAKARMDGPNYIYSILTGYQDPPEDFEALSPITSYNPYFEGWEIAMMPPLFEGGVTYDDGTEASVEQMAKDVTNFLMWTAEPKLENRHEMGLKVVLFSIFLTILLYFSMKKIWRRVKK